MFIAILITFGAILLAAVLGLLVFIFIIDRSNGWIVSSNEKRYYLLHVPHDLDAEKPVPLVVALHGSAEWPALSSWVTKWNHVANENGFIVVHPSGSRLPKRWRTHGELKGITNPEIDIRFIADLITKIQSQYNIDSNRIFASGFSNGGGLAYLLSCILGDRIAAIGCISGAYFIPLEKCIHPNPVPLILFHGTSDKVVPYLGGPSGPYIMPFPDIPNWVAAYAKLNQSDPTPQNLPSPSENVNAVRYIGLQNRSEVQFYTIRRGGHSWPGGNPLPRWIVGETSREVDATSLMWEFFKAHPLH